tara:strand:- start:760 stop:1680 length:921 start_codon:yes stop_codon:yes gene_type:complete
MAKKSITQKEQRAKIIKARQERLARDAKKQGITPEALLKKKRDTYLGVVGGAASLALPFGAIARGATALFKGIGGAAKVSKVGTTVAKGAKKVSDTAKKLKTSKTPTKTVSKTPTKTTPKKVEKKTPKKQKQENVLAKRKDKQKTTKKTDTKKTGSSSIVPKVIGAGGAAALLTTLMMKNKDGSAKAGAMPKSRPKSIKPKNFGMGMVDDFGKGRRKGSPEGGTAPIKPKKKTSDISQGSTMAKTPKKSKPITAGGNVGFGPKGNIFPSNAEERKKLMNKYGGTGSAAAKAAAQGRQGSMKKVSRT